MIAGHLVTGIQADRALDRLSFDLPDVLLVQKVTDSGLRAARKRRKDRSTSAGVVDDDALDDDEAEDSFSEDEEKEVDPAAASVEEPAAASVEEVAM